MTTRHDLARYFASTGYQLIIASDTEPRLLGTGGVAVALDPIAQAAKAVYITRSRPQAKTYSPAQDHYQVKRLAVDPVLIEGYYNGFANQALWPLCHVVFEEPVWRQIWFEQYKKVNQQFAKAIKSQLSFRKKTLIWINDYQLALVPAYLGHPKNALVATFWHIPLPTWETFRVLPFKGEILASLLACNFLGFHRGYHVSNFRRTVGRELEARIDLENQKIYFQKNVTKINNLPLGIDNDVIDELAKVDTPLVLDSLFKEYQVILSVDRLDYTKGIKHRLRAFDRFLEQNPGLRGKVVLANLIALSRQSIPSFARVKVEVAQLAEQINRKYQRGKWQPIHLSFNTYPRQEVIQYYRRAKVCLVTPLDDGMNLVSKEFVVASAGVSDPGMLVLSQFAGSALDLTSALIVNPYDINAVARAIKQALVMPVEEKRRRLKQMARILEERNVYHWGMEFIRQALEA